MKSQFKQTSKIINDEVNHVLKEIDEQQIVLFMDDVLSKNRIFIIKARIPQNPDKHIGVLPVGGFLGGTNFHLLFYTAHFPV